MGPLIFTFLFMSLGHAATWDPSLIGRWKFIADRYQGNESPLPNPALNLTLEFRSDGTDLLAWTRTGEPGHCLRTAHFQTDHGFLSQTVVSVDPGNTDDCSSDPDMQMGAASTNAYRIVEGRLELDLALGDDVLTYIWARVLW